MTTTTGPATTAGPVGGIMFHTTTHDTLAAMLATTRGPGRDRARKLGNNTYAERRDDDAIAIRLHTTDVLTFYRDGRVTYDTGEWMTVTTKARMNTYGPAIVGSDRGVWTARYGGRDYAYADGLTVDMTTGAVTGAGTWAAATQARRDRAAIAAYARDYAAAPWSGPSAGDCWLCLFVDDDGRPWGDMTGDHGHLREHMRERYYPGALGVNALRAAGYNVAAAHYLTGDIMRRAVARYLRARLTATEGSRPTTTGAAR